MADDSPPGPPPAVDFGHFQLARPHSRRARPPITRAMHRRHRVRNDAAIRARDHKIAPRDSQIVGADDGHCARIHGFCQA
jgi:hypothetical protein